MHSRQNVSNYINGEMTNSCKIYLLGNRVLSKVSVVDIFERNFAK